MGSVKPFVKERQVVLRGTELETLQEIEKRVLWIATAMVHHANNVRPNTEKSKVGGHQASSASVVSIITALYFHFLQTGDRVSIKPHASPAFHAAQYLLGRLDGKYLTTLREFKGLQAYPSRTKDPDPVDFSTGSVGLGAVAPVYAALASEYGRLHFGKENAGRFVALMGDAELDEGNVWETVAEEAVRGLNNVIWIVDLNRQSLDRVIPGVKAARLKALFAGAGWTVLETKYGTRLSAAMQGPGGDALRRRIDEMSNEEYQSIIRLSSGEDIRRRVADVAGAAFRKDILKALASTQNNEMQAVISNLGGHDLPALLNAFEEADAVTEGPVVIFAYTIKGYGLPIAGDPMNHSLLLSDGQMKELALVLGANASDLWANFAPDSAAGLMAASAAARQVEKPAFTTALSPDAVPAALDVRHPRVTSTQEAFGRSLGAIADLPLVKERIVTISPDVATSTHLSGWINKAGVFALEAAPDFDGGAPKLLKWKPGPQGHHIELGISEMNLFMALGQFGLSAELTGEHLVPVGTVYDPFVCRGLDALIYGLYAGSKFIFAGTPAGVSLSPEGGAHQSAITPSIGLELPGVVLFEPASALETGWILMDGIRRCSDRKNGDSTYLRLSTKPVDQQLFASVLQLLGDEELRRQTLAGGYRLIDRQQDAADLLVRNTVQIFTGGIMAAEAVDAARRLHEEGIAANVIVVTSPDRLFSEIRQGRKQQLANANADLSMGHLESLILHDERRAPIVTVQDGASHSLAFLGAAYGVPVVPLGVDEFGQSGTRQDLYHQTGIDVDQIVNAAMLALDLAQG